MTTPLWKKFAFYMGHAGVRLLTLPFCKMVTHAERLPPEPYIIVANHRSLLDAPYVVNEFNILRKRAMHMIGYQEPFRIPILGPLITLSGSLPFDRSDPESRIMVLRQALGFLSIGEPVGVFPEAHLSMTGKMRRGRPGAAILALESGAPVVPVAMRGTEKVLEPGTHRLHFRRAAEMEIGFPLDFSAEYEKFHNGSAQEREAVLDETIYRIMMSLAKLSGQEYNHSIRRRTRQRPGGAG